MLLIQQRPCSFTCQNGTFFALLTSLVQSIFFNVSTSYEETGRNYASEQGSVPVHNHHTHG